MTSELTDDEKAFIAALLRETIAASRFPLSPRVRSFRLDPRPIVETLPPPKAPGELNLALRKKRRR